jgi:hypothetical protein
MMKNNPFLFVLAALVCICFAACDWDNPIMEKWWEEPPEEPLYVPIIKSLPPEQIYETIIEEEYIYQTIYEKLPPEVIIEQLPPEIIIQYVTDADIQNYLNGLPPEEILDKLTEEQIAYITSKLPPKVIIEQIPPEVIIKQLPPQILLQSISIIDIEYIIFSGDATVYNGNSPTSGGTSLTSQEKSTNNDIVSAMAELLKSKDYMLILHGHANPVTNTAEEAEQLKQISIDRANAVKTRLASIYSGGEPLDNRITTKGYGGERNVSLSGSSAYSSLNRRVEAILFTIVTIPASGGN